MSASNANYIRGGALESDGRLDEAIEAFRQALQDDPESAAARQRLAHLLGVQGHARQQRGDAAAAIDDYEESLALDPAQPLVCNNLGNAYLAQGRHEDAAAAFGNALALDPGLAEAHLNLANLLQHSGASAQAIAHYRSALERKPGLAEAGLNLGYLLAREGDGEGALRSYRAAIAADPELAEAHFNYALQLLLAGDYDEGWSEYEWRLRRPDLAQFWPHAGRPRWDGAALAGRTILLYAEQGLGDAIQFVRYVPLVAQRGAKVILSCAEPLAALFASVPGAHAVVSAAGAAPDFDLCCSLLSLPRIFRTRLETIPAEVPYLRVAPDRRQRWSERLALAPGALKVGLAWASQSANPTARARSLGVEALEPLAGAGGVVFCSLQREPEAGHAALAAAGLPVIARGGELADFADTAALISSLDLVISIDTAAAHLAGALGKPIWTLVDWPPEWRWLLGREDSPWYPSMRLFRRKQGEPWHMVLAQVAFALKVFARQVTSLGTD